MGIDVFDIAAKSFSSLVNNRTVLVYAFIGGIVGALLSATLISQISALRALSGTSPSSVLLPALLAIVGTSAIGIVVSFLINVFIRGSIISAANAGAKASLGRAASQAVKRYLVFLVTTLVVSIAVAIGLILLVIPGIYLAVKLSVAPVEAVVGKKGVVASLQSSWSKTEGNFLAILAVLVVVVIAIWIISVVLGRILLFAGLSPVGSFVSEFVGYSLTVSLVLIYQGISGPKAKKRRGR
jgi:hypothetical protein